MTKDIAIYRIVNNSDKAVGFETLQGVPITIKPGDVIDLFSFEVEDAKSFETIRQADGIEVLTNQVCALSEQHLESLKRGIREYRGSESEGRTKTTANGAKDGQKKRPKEAGK